MRARARVTLLSKPVVVKQITILSRLTGPPQGSFSISLLTNEHLYMRATRPVLLIFISSSQRYLARSMHNEAHFHAVFWQSSVTSHPHTQSEYLLPLCPYTAINLRLKIPRTYKRMSEIIVAKKFYCLDFYTAETKIKVP